MPEVFVGIGGNVDPERALPSAIAALEARFGRVRCSAFYGSAAIGGEARPYLNAVVAFDSAAGPTAVRDALGDIERAAGRRRDDPAVCKLDLDLLLYGCRVDAVTRVPRPGLFERSFVVVPLAELAPTLTHPLTGERAAAAAARAARSPPLTRL